MPQSRIMNSCKFIFLLILIMIGCQPSKGKLSDAFSQNQIIVSDDIGHFWEAYDSIYSTSDTLKQMQYLKTLFLERASIGQLKMMEARGYTAEEYLQSIKSRPLFWNSLRPNMQNLFKFNEKLKKGVDKLAAIYPALKPSTIYYTIGNFRSPGTGVDSMVLVGSEFALGDSTTITSELPDHIQNYYKINPATRLEFLTVHEYIHTQQHEMVHNLLSLTLYEGIAEFMAIKATGQKSPWKAFDVGAHNNDKVRARFEKDMFNDNAIYSWLWNSSNNEFQASDMGYYVGSKLASIYYANAKDKSSAIKSLIELDFNNDNIVKKIVDSTNYFSKSLEKLNQDFDNLRPYVVSIEQLKNGGELNENTKQLTIHFSEPMNPDRRGFDYGPLGERHLLAVQKVVGFSEDSKSFTFEVDLKKNKHYQSTITQNFMSTTGFPLKPYLLDFTTK